MDGAPHAGARPGVFVQAESELGAINMALGAAATGARVLVVIVSPGISLMAEGMSYMAGSELPLVLINVMRGGPGLGSIQPSQSDYFQATKGHGHGDYRVPVLAPSSIAEAIELVATAFELAERYRTPVMILADGVLGQAMEPVVPQFRALARAEAPWALTGAAGRPPRVVRSLHLRPEDLEDHNRDLQAKFRTIEAARGPLGRGAAGRRRGRDRRLRHGRARRPDGDGTRAGGRDAGRAPPAGHPLAVPVGYHPGDRPARPGDPGRRAVRRPDGRGRATRRRRHGARSSSTAAWAAWCRPRRGRRCARSLREYGGLEPDPTRTWAAVPSAKRPIRST